MDAVYVRGFSVKVRYCSVGGTVKDKPVMSWLTIAYIFIEKATRTQFQKLNVIYVNFMKPFPNKFLSDS